MATESLVIVDVQPDFTFPRDGVFLERIREYISAYPSSHIFVVEFDGFGPTILELPEGVTVIRKDCTSGGYLLRASGLPKGRVTLCGLYGTVCVYDTAYDLKNLGYEVFIDPEACFDEDSEKQTALLVRLNGG